jgi:hypothetical protein
MFGPSVRLSKDLWERVKRVAEAAEYSSPQEFIEHVLERELSKIETADSKKDLIEKLKGLGYLE